MHIQTEVSYSDMSSKPGLIIVASPRAQSNPASPLLRLVRDYSRVLKVYEIHATEETARTILGTGIYKEDEVKRHRSGADGGIAQLAAMVARRQCTAAILFLDPSDPWSDAVENRALTRVCIHYHVRLMTTYSAALRWATYEAQTSLAPPKVTRPSLGTWRPSNWRDGCRNVNENGEFIPLPVDKRTIALISHDRMKLEMVRFVNDDAHIELLAKHQRVLATGTTGWILKLLFCTDPRTFQADIRNLQLEERLNNVMDDILNDIGSVTHKHEGFDTLLKALRTQLKPKINDEFTNKLIPLPSGPHGGDVLAADQVLCNECHTIIFFHDPLSAHPHNDDIRLLERTSRLPGVFAECVSDRQSAQRWMDGLREETAGHGQFNSIAQSLREKYGLKEVILAETDDNKDSDELGAMLARICAGFLNQWLEAAGAEKDQVRIGIAWGWGLKQVLEELKNMHDEGIMKKPAQLPPTTIWSPIIGIITAEMTDREASMIAEGFCSFYGGKCERFGCAGFAPENSKVPESITNIIDDLKKADIVLTSASVWDKNASLARNTGLNQSKLPPYSKALATISGVFLDEDGKEVRGEYSVVGLGLSGLKEVSQNGAVVLMCGGESRNPVVLSALRAGFVSILITTRQTANWVLQHD